MTDKLQRLVSRKVAQLQLITPRHTTELRPAQGGVLGFAMPSQFIVGKDRESVAQAVKALGWRKAASVMGQA